MYPNYFQDKNFILYNGNCIEVLKEFEAEKFNLVFADPPYFLSNGGISCQSGKMASVNKGPWDKSKGFEEDLNFNNAWIKSCKRVLKKDGTLWISGTLHNIYKIGYLLEKNGFDLINDIVWFKPNAPPNLTCKYFTHSHEILLWARNTRESQHIFNYEKMKSWVYPKDKLKKEDKQMRSVWQIPIISPIEKKLGKHPTQKPIELLNRIVSASTKEDDWVLDPFVGSGTTGIVCSVLKRKFIGIDTNEFYLNLAIKRYKDKNKVKLIRKYLRKIDLTKYLK